MANNPIGGNFEMFEAEASLGGGQPINTSQAQNGSSSGFLPLDQALNLSPQPVGIEKLAQNSYIPKIEAQPIKIGGFSEIGIENQKEIIFKDQDEIRSELLNKLMGENAIDTKSEPGKIEEVLKTEPQTSQPEKSVTSEKIKNISQNTLKSTIETSITTAHDLYKETKELFSAIGSLFKDYIIFKLETKEQKAAREKAAAKKKEKAANIRAFFSEVKALLSNYLMKKQKDSAEEQNRLEITGLGIAERNKAMGQTRNLSDEDINTRYHNHETYNAMVAAREEEKKKENEIKQQQTQAIDRTQIKYAGEMGGSQHVLNTAG